MLKDIPNYKVEDIGVAIVPKNEEAKESEDELWDVYLVNLKKDAIFNVLISTEGYGEKDGEKVKTSTLRHFIEGVEGESYVLIEPIQQAVFELTNQYWVSFKIGNTMYDRKYVFVRGSINKDNFTKIPILNKKGVLIM